MADAVYLNRKLIAKDREVLADYTQLAGMAVWASNALHAKFLIIFEEVMLFDCASNRPIKRRVARSMWHSLRSDDIQRAVLRSAVMEAMEQSHKFTRALVWALKAAGDLSEFRNDAVHTAFEFSLENKRWAMVPNRYAGAPKRIEKLNRVGYAKLFRLLLGDLIQLRIYVDYVRAGVQGDRELVLPRRPVLKSSLLVQQSPPKSSSRQSRGSKSPPPRPGRAPSMRDLRRLLGEADARRLEKMLE